MSSELDAQFHDDPTVNESNIIIFLRQDWWYAEKREVLERGEGKTKLRGRGGVGSIATELKCIYLYLGYSQPIIYSIFCLLFYKQILYFIAYQINKSNIFLFFFLKLLF